jgi:hypothetical protein
MGFISFGINVLESIQLFERVFSVFNYYPLIINAQAMTQLRIKIFQLVHICLFTMSVVYIISTSVSYFFCRLIWRRWSNFEASEMNEQGIIIRQYREMKKKHHGSNIILRYLNLIQLFHYILAIEKYNYYCIRERFIHIHKLPNNFRFDIYLKARIRKLFLHIIEIGIEVWAFFLVVMLINYGRVFAYPSKATDPLKHCLVAFFSMGCIPLGLCLVAYVVCRLKYRRYERDSTFNANKRIKNSINSSLEMESKSTNTPDNVQSNHPLPTLQQLLDTDYDVDMNKYFLFKKSRILFFIMQVILISIAFYITILILNIRYICMKELAFTWIIRLILYLLFYTPAILVLLFIFPFIIAPYTILTSVENYTSHKTIIYTLKRTEVLRIRGKINKVLKSQPSYHPLSKLIKKALIEQYPILVEQGDFLQEKYFVHKSNKVREEQKQLKNLILFWHKKMTLVKKENENENRNLKDIDNQLIISAEQSKENTIAEKEFEQSAAIDYFDDDQL